MQACSGFHGVGVSNDDPEACAIRSTEDGVAAIHHRERIERIERADEPLLLFPLAGEGCRCAPFEAALESFEPVAFTSDAQAWPSLMQPAPETLQGIPAAAQSPCWAGMLQAATMRPEPITYGCQPALQRAQHPQIEFVHPLHTFPQQMAWMAQPALEVSQALAGLLLAATGCDGQSALQRPETEQPLAAVRYREFGCGRGCGCPEIRHQITDGNVHLMAHR